MNAFSEHPPPETRVNLNTADRGALTTIPGIGLALAERILAHREQSGPFTAPEDLLAVNGIGPALLASIADRIAVTGPAEPVEAAPESAAGKSSDAGSPPATSPARTWTEEAHVSSAETTTEQAAAPVIPESVRKRLSALRLDFASAVLGALLALLAIAGLNGGSLILNQQPQVVQLLDRADALDARADRLESDVSSLRTRLEALEGLTRRVDQAQAAVGELEAAVKAAQSGLSGLETRVDGLRDDVQAARLAADRFDALIAGLRDLIAGLSEPAPTPSPTGSPTARPSPTPAQPSPTPALTGTPTGP